MQGQFGEYHNDDFGNHDSEDWGEEMIHQREILDLRLRRFVRLADERAAAHFAVLAKLTAAELGSPKHMKAKRGLDRAHQWADYCQNRRYELRGM